MANRDWVGVEQIGIDEIAVFKGHRYLTCVYQPDKTSPTFVVVRQGQEDKNVTAIF